MKKPIKQIFVNSGVVMISVFFISGVGFVFAAPTTAPSAGVGVDLPLTTGTDAQTKTGDLTVSGSLNSSNLCLGGACKTAWPAPPIATTGSLKTTNFSRYYTQYVGWSGAPYITTSVSVSVAGPGVLVYVDPNSLAPACPAGTGPSNVKISITNPTTRTVNITAICSAGQCWGYTGCTYSGNFSGSFKGIVIN